MAPTEYDNMFQNFANHVSRSELLRRLSNHSNSTSGSSKRGLARVTKQTSASNSPNYVQRRRTTANHTTRSYPRATQENPYETREQRLRNYYSSKQPIPSSRPMSWHPGSDVFFSPSGQAFTGRPALGNTIVGLENLAVSDTQTPSLQQSIETAFAMACNHSAPAPASTCEYSTAETQNYEAPGLSPDPGYDSYPTYSVSDHAQYPYMPQPLTYDMCTPTAYQSTQQWPQYSSYYPMASSAPQAGPECPPAQASVNVSRKAKATSAPQLSRRKSKELIGMGLYDDRRSNFMSGLGTAVSEDVAQDSMGKGLKLEETWQPPNEDEEEADDEGYSTDEAEEVEETPPTIMASSPAEAQTAVYPTYADMSNQSFFFNDDDEYTNEAQYANYLAYGQPLPGSQPKPHSNPRMENYLWL